jgi:hypothetical protein
MTEVAQVGLDHLGRCERIAVVSDVKWIRIAVKAFGFLLPGRLWVFERGDATAARAWIGEA